MKKTIIHLIGFPGTGKYTIAQELSSLNSFVLIDNHLINNPIFSLIDLDGKTKLSERVWDNTAKIWDAVFDTMINISNPQNNYILTSALFDNEEKDIIFFKKIMHVVGITQSIYVPVRLLCNKQQLMRRITEEDRKARLKETSPDNAEYNIENRRVFFTNHRNEITLETSDLSPSETAKNIIKHINDL